MFEYFNLNRRAASALGRICGLKGMLSGSDDIARPEFMRLFDQTVRKLKTFHMQRKQLAPLWYQS